MKMRITEFVHETDWGDLPRRVIQQAQRCLLDTLGVSIGGRSTRLSQIIHDFVATVYRGQGALLWLDGREVSPPGAALANGMTVDSLDAHDGYALAKGHAGAALIPTVLATLTLEHSKAEVPGSELLTTLVIGYEVALRAGISLHATACDYHTSGAWNALGCTAVTARLLRLDSEQTRHALGVAEYLGPRSQMMRCIDFPTMLKDGSGWGAMTGVCAALLAQKGFTGAPAVTVESQEVENTWDTLGEDWLIADQYFKPHAACRWAQPAIEAVLALQRTYSLSPETVKRVRVSSFEQAIRLDLRHPHTTEEAQYSLAFPLAAAMVHGRLGVSEVSEAALEDDRVLRLSERVELVEDPSFTERFPAERFARVEIETVEGQSLDSGVVEARWEAADPPTDAELGEKFHRFARDCISESRAMAIEQAVWQCANLSDAAKIVNLLAFPPDTR